MALLTKHSRSALGGYSSGYTRPELINKLGGIEYKSPPLSEAICDRICRFRDCEQQDLDDICEGCPLTQLMALIE